MPQYRFGLLHLGARLLQRWIGSQNLLSQLMQREEMDRRLKRSLRIEVLVSRSSNNGAQHRGGIGQLDLCASYHEPGSREFRLGACQLQAALFAGPHFYFHASAQVLYQGKIFFCVLNLLLCGEARHKRPALRPPREQASRHPARSRCSMRASCATCCRLRRSAGISRACETA